MDNFDEKTSDLQRREVPITKLKEIILGFKQNLRNLHQKIEIIDSKPELQRSIKNYKQKLEKRANELESEVKWLREELKSIHYLLGVKLKNSDSGKS
jgi:chromosome segregation ATPase